MIYLRYWEGNLDVERVTYLVSPSLRRTTGLDPIFPRTSKVMKENVVSKTPGNLRYLHQIDGGLSLSLSIYEVVSRGSKYSFYLVFIRHPNPVKQYIVTYWSWSLCTPGRHRRTSIFPSLCDSF